MSPPAGPGQQHVLQMHYQRAGSEPVAYVDETFHVARDGRRRFYVMAAVIILEADRDPLRKDLDELVPDGRWHTSNELLSNAGRERTRRLLRTLQSPEETCVIIEKTSLDTHDSDGLLARRAVLSRLLAAVHDGEYDRHPPVPLVVLRNTACHA